MSITVMAAMTTAPSFGQGLTLIETARFDLSTTANSANAQFIGSNPSAVAWNGSRLFVGGFNAAANAQNTAIIEVLNATTSGFVSAPTFGTAFNVLSTNSGGRGYSGIALKGNTLAAAWDNTGSAIANGIVTYDVSTSGIGNALWTIGASGTAAARGSSGVAFDPGFQGDPAQGSGVAWMQISSGRRMLQDAVSGTNIYTTATGMIVNTNPVGTTWRDFDFDPATGNIYMRRANDVVQGIRTGSNAIASGQSQVIVDVADATAVVGQNLSFMSSITKGLANQYEGNALVYNDRPNTNIQPFTTAVRFVTTSGSSIGASWNFLSISGSTATPLDGTGYYDFSYDPTTQSLAVLDFSNRTVSIFAVPEPSTWAMAGLAGAALAGQGLWRARAKRRRRAVRQDAVADRVTGG